MLSTLRIARLSYCLTQPPCVCMCLTLCCTKIQLPYIVVFLIVRSNAVHCSVAPHYEAVLSSHRRSSCFRQLLLLFVNTAWFPSTFFFSSLLLLVYLTMLYQSREPGNSVSIVSGYGLDDLAIEVRSPAEAKDFSSNLCVQTGSGAHPASCTMVTGGSFPGVKRGRA
jgi:hypothetical protein